MHDFTHVDILISDVRRVIRIRPVGVDILDGVIHTLGIECVIVLQYQLFHLLFKRH